MSDNIVTRAEFKALKERVELLREGRCPDCGGKWDWHSEHYCMPAFAQPAEPTSPAPMPRLRAQLDELYYECIHPQRVRGWMGTAVFIEAARDDLAEARKQDAARIAELKRDCKMHLGALAKAADVIKAADARIAALEEVLALPVPRV